MEAYRQNPVVLDSHDYRSIENIAGVARRVQPTEAGLEVDVAFNSTPRGQLAHRLVEEGSLRAVSVGFISRKADYPKDGKGPVVHRQVELLEIGVVAVPAQAEALLVRSLADRVSAAVSATYQELNLLVARLDLAKALLLLGEVRKRN